MFITKMHLSRRTVLRGLGATLSLPLLDSMVPALTALSQTAAAPIRRMGVFYVPNGMNMGSWLPQTEGPIEELPPTLRSLQALKENVLMLGGLDDDAANKIGRAGPHAGSSGTFLTCAPFKTITDANVQAETTMDQIAAKQFGKETQLASLELGIDSVELFGSCDNASCVFTNSISWSTPTTPLPPDNDPRALFERLFGVAGSTDPAARLSRIKRDRSILDIVNEQIQRLNTRMGPADRAKFEQCLESVRDVERRIQKAEEQNSRQLPVVNQPMGIPTDYSEHAKLMMDLLALAYQTDMTRVSTFMLAHEGSQKAYPEIGVSDSHHPVSHHANDPVMLERLAKINEYHFQHFAYLVEKLSTTPEGDGTMLDHSLFLYGTGISDSNTHVHDNVPIALIGGKALGIQGGRYVKYPQGTPLANLHVTFLDKLGVHVDKFGDSSGKLQSL